MSDHVEVLRRMKGWRMPPAEGEAYNAALDAAIAALSAPPSAPVGVEGFTTGHCERNKRPGGCDLHNLHCGYPKCDRRPTIAQRPAAVNEAAIRYALDHARDLDDGVARVVAALAQQPGGES